jgi:hypothetical protein
LLRPLLLSVVDAFGRSVAGVNSGFAVHLHTCTCRDEFTDKHVFLQAEKRILLTLDSRFRENLGGFLEGCCGKEGFGRKRCLGDTKKLIGAFCGNLLRSFGMCFPRRQWYAIPMMTAQLLWQVVLQRNRWICIFPMRPEN